MHWRILVPRGISIHVIARVIVTNASAPRHLVKRANGVLKIGTMSVLTIMMTPIPRAHGGNNDTAQATSDDASHVQVLLHCRILPSHIHARCKNATAKMSPWICLAMIVIKWIAQTNYRHVRPKSGRANC